MASPYTPEVQGTGVKATIQRIGGYLAGMIMPNIGAFIAWGLITALFIDTGWWPNETLAELVGPIITTLLPILIGYTGGRMVHGQRGAVVGAVATMGVVVGSDVPMFLGAMIMGPLAAFIIKLVDRAVQERTKAGFEMLVDNFTAGIIGAVMAIAGALAIGPVVQQVTNAAGAAVGWLVDHSLLPLASVLIEPAKVLFLNNAINHGVLGPLGVAEASRAGDSILFMLESNPGPGLGLLLAYMFFGPRLMRASTPASAIIHFFGGIHEIYFPYVLMKPRMILAVIAGGITGVATFMVTGVGLVATPAPGSIFAYLTMTPRGAHIGVILGILLSTGASFLVGSLLLGFGRAAGDEPGDDTEPEQEESEPAAEGEAGIEAGAGTGSGDGGKTENTAARDTARKDDAPVMKEA